MLSAATLFLFLPFGTPEAVETRFEQVHPPLRGRFARSPGQNRAVVLIPGIKLHPFNGAKASEASFHDWQMPDKPLVKAIAKDADVYAYAYGQTTPLETIAEGPGLAHAVGKLKEMGYEEIVLVGHSAGGVLARLFVEDHPESGVTKVIQICAPNDGSSLANANISVRKEQEPFLLSLTKKERIKQCTLRCDKKIPRNVDFACIVGALAGVPGDGIVSCQGQWAGDLQKQGIPAVRINAAHFTVMRHPATIDQIAEVIRSPQPRWSPEMVEKMRKQILGELKK